MPCETIPSRAPASVPTTTAVMPTARRCIAGGEVTSAGLQREGVAEVELAVGVPARDARRLMGLHEVARDRLERSREEPALVLAAVARVVRARGAAVHAHPLPGAVGLQDARVDPVLAELRE